MGGIGTKVLVLLAAASIGSSQEQSPPRLIYDQPVTQSLRLQVSIVDTYKTRNVCCSTVATVRIVDRESDASVEIASISEEYETAFAVERADDRTMVLARSNPDYGFGQGRIKLFFDASGKQLLKRIDFDSARDIAFPDDTEAARLLGVTSNVVLQLRQRGVLSAKPAEPSLPAAFKRRPLPQSTYQHFARARPARVRDGYDRAGTTIEERIGAHQRAGDRIWFGKVFYDGEGTTGVGAIGSLGPAGVYAFLRIPELYDWSVQGLVVEPEVIWAGRVSHGEGADHSGGLVRYDRQTRRVQHYDVPDVIHSIARVGEAVFVGTGHGLYVIGNGTKMRYRVEPDIAGRFIVMAEDLTRGQAR
jgi:hypothetical protein